MPEIVTEDLAALVNLNLAKLAIPQLSSHEQMHLADIIECVATAEKHRQSMDDNAMRYLLFFRQHMLRKGQAPHNRVDITWREIVWAYHSGSQDVLVDLISRQFGGRICWDHAKESGMFMWITDLSALVGFLLSLSSPLLTPSRGHSLNLSPATNIQRQMRKILSTVVSIISRFGRKMS